MPVSGLGRAARVVDRNLLSPCRSQQWLAANKGLALRRAAYHLNVYGVPYATLHP